MNGPQRFDRLDALRAAAIVWMALFHLAFDLNHFGWLNPKQNFYTDPLWTVQRSCIVSLFLFSTAVAGGGGAPARTGRAGRWADRRARCCGIGRLHVPKMISRCTARRDAGWRIGRRCCGLWLMARCIALPGLQPCSYALEQLVGLGTHKPVTELHAGAALADA